MLIHHSLVQLKALGGVSRVRILCIHGDMHDYSPETVEMCYQGKKHRVKAVVSSHLMWGGGGYSHDG